MAVVVGYTVGFATIINIPADYPNIQDGVDISLDGDTVLVQPGTYVENINFNGHNITLGSQFLTTGDTAYISETIIDGDSSGSVVTFESGEDSTAIITGFTLQNGYASSGAGIYCIDSGPSIVSNIIKDNYLMDDGGFFTGGGIYCENSNIIISGNKIFENSAGSYNGWGGGIACEYSSVVIINNVISSNLAYCGGGIYCSESNATIIDNLILENDADL